MLLPTHFCMFLTCFAAFWKGFFHSVVFQLADFFHVFSTGRPVLVIVIWGAAGCGLFWTSTMKLLEFLASKRSRFFAEILLGILGGLKGWWFLPVSSIFCSFRHCQVASCLSGFGIEILNNIVLEVKYLMMHMLFDMFFFQLCHRGPRGLFFLRHQEGYQTTFGGGSTTSQCMCLGFERNQRLFPQEELSSFLRFPGFQNI